MSSTRAPDFFAQARSRFRFLEDKYGFELAAAERGDWREELRYRNATTVVVVARDREYGNRVEVELGALPRGGAAPPERLIALPALVEVRAESPLAARRAERSLRGLEAELDHWATALARHAEDVLRGDLSVVAEIESRQEARYELITRVYLALSRRGLDEPAPKGAPEEEGVRWSMPAAEIAEALTERELDGRELSKPAVREIVARSVREWLPLRRRLRPGTRRGIDEAAAEICALWLAGPQARERPAVTEPQTDLSFADEARRAFDFLRAEHGFELASVEATRVAYRRGDLGIVIALHEEFGFAMVKLQQLAGGRWPHVGEQSLWDLIPEAEQRAVREAPGSELDRYAQALARWGVRLLAT